MIFGLLKRKKSNQLIVQRLYATLTEAGRAQAFYSAMGVPDTVMGRFEMLAAHMVVFFRRTKDGSPALLELAQDIVDAFFEDIDHSMREIGIGDTGVPKRMKKFARMFYGRVASYSAALDAGDRPALAAALARNIHPNEKPEGEGADARMAGMAALAIHLQSLAAYLETQSDATILGGNLLLPDPTAPAGAV